MMASEPTPAPREDEEMVLEEDAAIIEEMTEPAMGDMADE